MLKPARANSWTVASCSEPLGMPSFSFIASPPIHHHAHRGHQGKHRTISSVVSSVSFVLIQRSKTCSRAGVADVAVAEALHLQQHGVIVAIDQELDHLELVAGGLALHPQLVAAAAEE